MTAPQSEHPLSPATWLAKKFFGGLRYISFWAIPRALFAKRNPVFKFRGELSPAEASDTGLSIRRSRAIDLYVLFWTLTSPLTFVIVSNVAVSLGWQIAIYFLATVRLIESIQSPLNTLVFDLHRGRTDSNTASSSRLLVLTLLNTLEFAVWFAVLYALNLQFLCGARRKVDALYFSVMTQFTVGFGDIHPSAGLRYLATLQVTGGFLLAVIVLARAVTTLPAMKGLLDSQKTPPE